MYNRSDKVNEGPQAPQYNTKVPQKSSVTDKDYLYFEQKIAMMNNRGKNSGAKHLFASSQRTSLLESHQILN